MRDHKDWLEAEEDSKARATNYETDKIALTDIANNTASIAVELANLNANLCAIGHLLHNIDYTASFMIDIIRGR